MVAIDAIHRKMPQNWQLYEELLSRGQALSNQPRQSHLPPKTIWGRTVSSAGFVLSFLFGFIPVVGEGQQVSQHFLQGRTTQAAVGVGKMGRILAQSIHNSQSVVQGLFNIFMAYDKYSRAKLEAAYKEQHAGRMESQFLFDNALSYVASTFKHGQLGLQALSNMMAKNRDAISLIIRNI